MTDDILISVSAAENLARAISVIEHHFKTQIWSNEVFKSWGLVRDTLLMRGERLGERVVDYQECTCTGLAGDGLNSCPVHDQKS